MSSHPEHSHALRRSPGCVPLYPLEISEIFLVLHVPASRRFGGETCWTLYANPNVCFPHPTYYLSYSIRLLHSLLSLFQPLLPLLYSVRLPHSLLSLFQPLLHTVGGSEPGLITRKGVLPLPGRWPSLVRLSRYMAINFIAITVHAGTLFSSSTYRNCANFDRMVIAVICLLMLNNGEAGCRSRMTYCRKVLEETF